MALSFGRMRSIGLLGGGASPVGVDFGVGALKLLQVTLGEPQSLIAAALAPTPEELLLDAPKRLAWQFEQLPKLLKSGEFRGKRAVCSIPAPRMFCKHLQVQRSEGVATSALARAAVASQLACAPEALVQRHVEVSCAGRTGGRSEVICFAAGHDLVGQLMSVLRSCRMETAAIHPEHLALLQAFEPMMRRTEDADQPALYLDLGAGSTKAVVAHGRTPVFAKTIALGSVHLDQSIARQLECSLRVARSHRLAAESLTRAPRGSSGSSSPAGEAPAEGLAILSAAMRKEERPAGPAHPQGAASAKPGKKPSASPSALADAESEAPGATPRFDLSDLLEALTDEIQMCLRYHDSLFPGLRIGRAIFVGGQAAHRPLCEFVARRLRIPAQIADPLARVAREGAGGTTGADLKGPQPGWAVPLGLCISPTDL